MKCLSVKAPWGNFCALPHPDIGRPLKRYETRSWATNFRGPLALHVSKRVALTDMESVPTEYLTDLGEAQKHWLGPLSLGIESLYASHVIAVAQLVACHRIGRTVAGAVTVRHRPVDDPRELALGCYDPGRFAWELADVRPIRPVPARGSLGLWEWDGPVEYLEPAAASSEAIR